MAGEAYWQETTGAELRQGDYLLNCPVPLLLEPAEHLWEQTLPIGEGDLQRFYVECSAAQ